MGVNTAPAKIMKKPIKYLDYFFVLRPTLFFPVWTMSLAGLWAQTRFTASSLHPSWFAVGALEIKILFYEFLLTLLMGSVFLINQIEDVESDKLNNKLFLIANGDISISKAYLETIILAVLPVFFLLLTRFELGITLIIAYIVMGWLYSCRPFVFKNKPVGGIIPNVLGFYIVFSYGWMINGQPGMDMLYYATPYVLGLLGIYFLTTIPDIEGDRGANKITVAVKYGANNIIITGLIVNTLAIITAVIMRDLVIVIPTLLIFPFFVKTAITKSTADVLQTNKFAALFLSLVICYRFPYYLAILLVLYFFSKWYYKARFNINYPSLHKQETANEQN